MKIEAITIREIQMPLVHFFETSFGRTTSRRIVLITAHCEGLTGWSECVAGEDPFYSEESVETAWDVITRYLGPAILGRTLSAGRDCIPWFARVRGNRMAKAAIENALWDVEARERKQPPKDRDRSGGRLPAHQVKGKAGMGHRRATSRTRELAEGSAQL